MPRSGIGLNDLLGRLQVAASLHIRRPPRPKAQMPGRDPMMPRQSPALKRKVNRKAAAARMPERSLRTGKLKTGSPALPSRRVPDAWSRAHQHGQADAQKNLLNQAP